MMNPEEIAKRAARLLGDGELFVVDVKVSPANDIEVLIDSDASVSIDACVQLSRALQAELEAEGDDFSLTVSSTGIGQPLKVYRQYLKLVGRPVEVALRDGIRVIAQLREATPQSITLAYEEKRAVEGKKKKETFDVVKTYALDEVKATKEYLDFK